MRRWELQGISILNAAWVSKLLDAREAFKGVPGIEVKSSLPRWIYLTIWPEMKLRERVVQFFRSHLSDLPDEICDHLSMALHELLGNAIEHGDGRESQSAIEVTHIRTSRMILFQIRDAGNGFSLANINHAALNNPPDDPIKHVEYRSRLGMRPGGFGIMVVKQIADDLIYSERGNEVVFVKYLD